MIKLVDVYQERKAERILYDLLRERSTEDDPHINISHRALPTWHDHQQFVRSKPYRFWYLVMGVEEAQQEMPLTPLGSISLTNRNEIGIVLFKQFRGKGNGRAAVQEIMSMWPPLVAIPSVRPGHYIANINPSNEASIKLFTGLGARHIQNTYQFD